MVLYNLRSTPMQVLLSSAYRNYQVSAQDSSIGPLSNTHVCQIFLHMPCKGREQGYSPADSVSDGSHYVPLIIVHQAERFTDPDVWLGRPCTPLCTVELLPISLFLDFRATGFAARI